MAAFSRVFMSETGLIVVASEMALVYFIRSVIEALRLVDLKFLILPSTLDILPSSFYPRPSTFNSYPDSTEQFISIY